MNIGQTCALEVRKTHGYRDGWSHLDKHEDIGDCTIIDILNGSEEVCEDMCDMPRAALLVEYKLDPRTILCPTIECNVMDEAFHVVYQDLEGNLFMRSAYYEKGHHRIRISDEWLTKYRLDDWWQKISEDQVHEDFRAHFPVAAEQARKELLTYLTWVEESGLVVTSLPEPPYEVETVTHVEIQTALEDTFGGSGCTHEHDCCGCVSTSVTLVHFHDDNRAWLHLERSRNY